MEKVKAIIKCDDCRKIAYYDFFQVIEKLPQVGDSLSLYCSNNEIIEIEKIEATPTITPFHFFGYDFYNLKIKLDDEDIIDDVKVAIEISFDELDNIKDL